ncbi:MAG: hypothetical protein KI792_10195 [Alphaproteobacteria bacterium]|nr:hypothetical protein [Alphaproteobacteria bacterium SS10]
MTHIQLTQPQTTGRTWRRNGAVALLLPLLAACNAATAPGERSGLHTNGPVGDSDGIFAGPPVPVPESKILGDAFEPSANSDSLPPSEVAQALPGVIEEQARSAVARSDFSAAAAYYALLYYRDQRDERLAIKYAEALRRSGSADQALAVLKPFAEPESATPQALIAYAKANLKVKRLAAAVQSARWAVDADPTLAEAYHVLATTLDAMTNHREAQAAYQSALAHGIGDSHRTLNNLAMSYAQSGELAMAQSSLRQALQLAGDDPTVQANLQLVSTMASQQRLKPMLALSLPTRTSGEPAEPTRHPRREWAVDRGADPRSFQTGTFESFDRLVLPRLAPGAISVENDDGLVTVKLPATIVANLPKLTKELERSVETITMQGDAKGIALSFQLKPDVAIFERAVEDRMAIDFLIDPAEASSNQQASR